MIARRTIAVLAVTVLLSACADDGPTAVGSDHGPHSGHPAAPVQLAGAAGPSRHVGPQGRAAQFVVHCEYSHSAPDDPIVQPGRPGAAHRHDFYGAAALDHASTAETLVAGETTCDKTVDKAGYWQPALYDHREVVTPLGISAYYRAAPGVAPRQVEPMPLGLELIAGDQTATSPQPGEATGWTCGSSTVITDRPPDCPAGAPLHLVLTFQDCWDGVFLGSEDHVSHAAYSDEGDCPASHPVHLPQLTVSVAFPVWGAGHELSLASGSIYSAHGDFLNAWEPDGLAREVQSCIHRQVVCDLASNRGEEPLFSAS